MLNSEVKADIRKITEKSLSKIKSNLEGKDFKGAQRDCVPVIGLMIVSCENNYLESILRSLAELNKQGADEKTTSYVYSALISLWDTYFIALKDF